MVSSIKDIIDSSLELCGKLGDEKVSYSKALRTFNNMLKTYDFNPSPTEETLTLIVAQSVYTIGTAGNFNTTRPIEIISSYIRDSNGTDYPVRLFSKKDYDAISDKDYPSRPGYLYYAPEYPLGKIYFDKAPITAESFYLTSKKPNTGYIGISDILLSPPEQEKALIYNLALDLAPVYGVQLSQLVIEQSIILKNEINQRKVVPTPKSKLDLALLR